MRELASLAKPRGGVSNLCRDYPCDPDTFAAAFEKLHSVSSGNCCPASRSSSARRRSFGPLYPMGRGVISLLSARYPVAVESGGHSVRQLDARDVLKGLRVEDRQLAAIGGPVIDVTHQHAVVLGRIG